MTKQGSFRFAVNGRSVENIGGVQAFKTAALNHSAILPTNQINDLAKTLSRRSTSRQQSTLLIQVLAAKVSYV